MKGNVLLILLVSLGVLFLITQWAQRKWNKHPLFSGNALLYSLGLTVYCTSWTFYGSVGLAASSGLLFLSAYLGPTIAFAAGAGLIRRFLQLRDQMGVTSYLDLIVVRAANSSFLGCFGSFFLLVGMIPYFALQLKSVMQTSALLAGEPAQPVLFESGVTLCCAVFTIFFGVRKLDSRERRPGLIYAVSVEAVVKLAAFLLVGILVWRILPAESSGGVFGLLRVLESEPYSQLKFIGLRSGMDGVTWVSWILLSAVAFLFLPRQFHMMVVENTSPGHFRSASWMVPLYFLLINLFVLPIAVYGRERFHSPAAADLFLLRIPLHEGYNGLAVIVFIAGFFASFGMLMVETISIAGILSNNVIAPFLARNEGLAFLRGRILMIRRVIVLALFFLAMLYQHVFAQSYGLVSIGMMSFTAVAQFLPVSAGALFWKRSSRIGMIAGLVSGAMVWFYTLLLPVFVRNLFPARLGMLESGPFGLLWLAPEGLGGFRGMDPIANAFIWSLLVNSAMYYFFSILFAQSAEEQVLVSQFLDRRTADEDRGIQPEEPGELVFGIKKERAREALQAYLPGKAAESLLADAEDKAGLSGQERLNHFQLLDFRKAVEQGLAYYIGGPAAKAAVDRSGLLSSEDSLQLELRSLAVMREFQINPRELQRRLRYQVEKEKLMRAHNEELSRTVERVSRELEEERLRAVQTAKMSALGTMAGGIAHEINNPLATISVSAEVAADLLQQSPPDAAAAGKVLGTIVKTVERIAKIVRGLRQFSREASGDAMEPVSVSAILDETLSLCRTRIESMKVELRLGEFDEKLVVMARLVEIEQVLINLISNSLDAVAGTEAAWIGIEVCADEAGCVRIELSDCGKGILDEIADKVMDPFFTTKPVGQGTGLGLSLSRSILEKHGGSLSLDRSCANTKFVVRLPRVPDPLPS